MTTLSQRVLRSAIALALLVGLPAGCGAYSVLTHEQVVDLLWKDDIEPLLTKDRRENNFTDWVKWCSSTWGG
jgi:hypothetical protein